MAFTPHVHVPQRRLSRTGVPHIIIHKPVRRSENVFFPSISAAGYGKSWGADRLGRVGGTASIALLGVPGIWEKKVRPGPAKRR